MFEHVASVHWSRDGADFAANSYSRAHEWHFDGGAVVAGSPSPAVVPPPMSDEAAVDPEEAFVASIASCHMLWFLDIARQKGFVVNAYRDKALGHMTRKGPGKFWISRVDLNPEIEWEGTPPTREELEALHHKAHELCFIANSVVTEIVTHLPD